MYKFRYKSNQFFRKKFLLKQYPSIVFAYLDEKNKIPLFDEFYRYPNFYIEKKIKEKEKHTSYKFFISLMIR